jgi:hypothetical protein
MKTFEHIEMEFNLKIVLEKQLEARLYGDMSEILDFKEINKEEIIEQEKNDIENSSCEDVLYNKNPIVYPWKFVETNSEICKGTDTTKLYL